MKISTLFSIFKTYKPTLLKSKGNVISGLNSYHNGNFFIRGNEEVTIGSYGAFGRNITLITSYHDTNFIAIQGNIYNKIFNSKHPGELLTPPNIERTKGGIKIGNDVWIGDNTIILSGVCIGNGACIAAGSIVTKDVQDYEFVAGVPAKHIKFRYSEEKIKFLQNLEWWNWSEDKIKDNKDLFFSNLNTLSLTEINNLLK